jgi:hypothetical protein
MQLVQVNKDTAKVEAVSFLAVRVGLRRLLSVVPDVCRHRITGSISFS